MVVVRGGASGSSAAVMATGTAGSATVRWLDVLSASTPPDELYHEQME